MKRRCRKTSGVTGLRVVMDHIAGDDDGVRGPAGRLRVGHGLRQGLSQCDQGLNAAQAGRFIRGQMQVGEMQQAKWRHDGRFAGKYGIAAS